MSTRLGLRLFHGGEPYLVERAFAAAWEELTNGLESDLDAEVLDGSAGVAEVVAAVSSVGFFSATRVVGIRDWAVLQSRPGRRPKNPSPDDPAEAAAAALAGLPPGSALVLSVRGTLPATHPVVALARARGEVREYPKLRSGDLTGWAAQRARELEIRIEHPALRLLVESVGDDLLLLDGELVKLAIYAGSAPVRVADVRALVPDTAEHQVWDITDALLTRPGRALLELDRALDAGEPAGRLSYMLARHLRILLAASATGPGAAGTRRLTEALSGDGRPLSEYTVKKAQEQVRGVETARLERLYRRAVSAEAASRRGEIDEESALRLLVLSAATQP